MAVTVPSGFRDCKICGQQFQRSDFKFISSYCRDCYRDLNKKRKCRSSDDVKRNATDAARKRKRRWARENADPEKNYARATLNRAIMSGAISRPDSCQRCNKAAVRVDGVTAIHGHHHDYSKPLDVIWLCASCHTKEHAAMEAER